MKIGLQALAILLFTALSFFLLGVLNPEVEYKEGKMIHAPDSIIYDIYTHPEKQGYWLPGLKSVETIAEGKLKLQVDIGGKERTIVQTFNPAQDFQNSSWTWEGEGFVMEHQIRLHDFGTHTKVEISGVVRGKDGYHRSLYTLNAYYFETLHRSLLEALEEAVLAHKFDK